MKRLLIRGTVLLVVLSALDVLLVRYGILLVTRLPYFENLPDAKVGWDGVCAAVFSAGCYLSGAIRNKGLRVVCVFAIALFALCFVQVNTVPLFRVVQAAIVLMGG